MSYFNSEEVMRLQGAMRGLIRLAHARIVEVGGLDLEPLYKAMCEEPYRGDASADDQKQRLLGYADWVGRLYAYLDFLHTPSEAAQRYEEELKRLMQTRGIEPQARNENTGKMVRA